MISPIELFGYEREFPYCYEAYNTIDQALIEFESVMNEETQTTLLEDLEYSIFGESVFGKKKKKSPDPVPQLKTDDSSTMFGAVGRLVRKIIDALRDAVEAVIDKIDSLTFGKKSDLQKVEKIAKANPAYAEQIREAFASGALNLQDVKTMNEANIQIEKLIKELNAGAEPKGIIGKVEAVCKKFNNSEITKAASTGLKMGRDAVGLYKDIRSIPKMLDEAQQSKENIKLRRKKREDNLAKCFAQAEKDIKNETDPKKKKKLQGYWEARLYCEGQMAKNDTVAVNAIGRRFNTLFQKFGRIADKFYTDDTKAEYHENLRKRAAELEKEENEKAQANTPPNTKDKKKGGKR